MTWFISKNIDSEVEFLARMEFYRNLRNRELCREIDLKCVSRELYAFNDANSDNRFMIIGHTDFAASIIKALKTTRIGRYIPLNFYVCACIMSYDYFHLLSGITSIDEVYITEQKPEFFVEDNELYLTCEYLDARKTGVGFKATRSELALLNAERKSFYGKLKECFNPLEKYMANGERK